MQGYGITTYGQLKLSPLWDPLRGDPRFEKIVASLPPKPRAIMPRMDAERWQQVKELFNAAIAYQPSERAAFLSRMCNGDEELLVLGTRR